MSLRIYTLARVSRVTPALAGILRGGLGGELADQTDKRLSVATYGIAGRRVGPAQARCLAAQQSGSQQAVDFGLGLDPVCEWIAGCKTASLGDVIRGNFNVIPALIRRHWRRFLRPRKPRRFFGGGLGGLGSLGNFGRDRYLDGWLGG